jgi:hypothetical protein
MMRAGAFAIIFTVLFSTSSAQSTALTSRFDAPDYSNLATWAAHPWKKDNSDSIAPFIKNEDRDTLADVFYLHPTTFTKGGGNADNNASLDDEELNKNTDSRPILYQASVFNNVCRVFAPRYRQAHLKNYFDPNSDESVAAFELAYQDLKKAFEYYLAHYNNGRPIVIASHSQGAMHAVRLLREFFDGKPLQKQLVCAYIVGWRIKKDDFTSIKVGKKPDATGCFVGWRSYKKGHTDLMLEQENGNSVCVNPITWSTSYAPSEKSEHKGMIGRDMSKPFKGAITAEISPETNVLWVEVPLMAENQFGKLANYHIADYNLFYLDIRENVKLRVNTFLKKK